MPEINNNAYIMVKDKHNNDYLCPVNAVKNRDNVSERELDECVEKDVVGRYAGNIEFRSH